MSHKFKLKKKQKKRISLLHREGLYVVSVCMVCVCECRQREQKSPRPLYITDFF